MYGIFCWDWFWQSNPFCIWQKMLARIQYGVNEGSCCPCKKWWLYIKDTFCQQRSWCWYQPVLLLSFTIIGIVISASLALKFALYIVIAFHACNLSNISFLVVTFLVINPYANLLRHMQHPETDTVLSNDGLYISWWCQFKIHPEQPFDHFFGNLSDNV